MWIEATGKELNKTDKLAINTIKIDVLNTNNSEGWIVTIPYFEG